MENDNTPVISVIIPVYKVENYIARCLQTILKQSYKKLEIIIVDDGSPDDSIQIAKEIVGDDPRVQFIYKENGGLSDARNYGLDVATGEFIVFVDSDDYVEPNYIKNLYKNISRTQADIAMCSFVIVDEHGKQIYDVLDVTSDGELYTGREVLSLMLKDLGYKYIVAWNKMYRSSLFKENRFKVGKLFEDEFMSTPLFYNLNRIVMIEEVLYNYVQRHGSIMQSSMNEEKILTKIELHTERIDFYKKQQDGELLERAKQVYCNWIVTTSSNVEILNQKLLDILQGNFRKNYPKKVYSIPLMLQNVLGYIDIRLAAYVKSKVLK